MNRWLATHSFVRKLSPIIDKPCITRGWLVRCGWMHPISSQYEERSSTSVHRWSTGRGSNERLNQRILRMECGSIWYSFIAVFTSVWTRLNWDQSLAREIWFTFCNRIVSLRVRFTDKPRWMRYKDLCTSMIAYLSKQVQHQSCWIPLMTHRRRCSDVNVSCCSW